MRNLVFSLICLVVLLARQPAAAQVPVLSSYPVASATLFLDFDGHLVESTSWNWSGSPIACAGSGMNATQITHVFNRVAEDYRPFNINVTTDSTKFLAAPINSRMRVIVTTTSAWYGSTAGGVAFIGSFNYGDDTPCFVFSALFGYNLKKISEAISHESGHTLGLYHQSHYDANCNKITDYYAGQGTGEIGWAPIMGVGYSRNFTLWSNGPNSLGCTNYQSDLEIITSSHNGFGYRADDHNKDFEAATPALFSNGQFDMSGIIEQNTDEDLFRFSMPGRGRFQLNATPYSVGASNAGSNIDLQLSLYNSAHTLLNVYNPADLLNLAADTLLNPGTYYLRVEGKGNAYASEYASLGSYSLKAAIETETPLPLLMLKLHGVRKGDTHHLNWQVEADEKITAQVIEASENGAAFTPLAQTGSEVRAYDYRPMRESNIRYRLKVHFVDGHYYYSNSVTLLDENEPGRPRILNNPVVADQLTVISPGNLSYSVMDMHGRIMMRGQLSKGINHIVAGTMAKGMHLIRFTDKQQQWTDKLLRQ